jgi:hypothetical protein
MASLQMRLGRRKCGLVQLSGVVEVTVMKNFAPASSVKEGTILVPDGRFTCMKANVEKRVNISETEQLYVECRCGRHYLDGQFENGVYLGFRLRRR